MNPNRRRHGSVAGEVEHVGGGHPAAASSSSVPATASSGLVLVSARSASRTRSWWAGWPASCAVARVGAARTPAEISGAKRLDVGAHHEDVARLEGGVVLEQPDQHLAQHVDLARRRRGTRAPGGAVVRRRARARRARRPSGRGWRAGRAGASRAGCSAPARSGVRGRSRLAGPAAERCAAARGRRAPARPSSGCPTRLGRGVVLARHRTADAGQRVPQLRRRLRQPEVDVAELAERLQQLDLGDRQPGVAEQREPATAGRAPRRRRAARASVSACRTSGARRVDPRDQPPPQLGLPAQVVVERSTGAVGVAALAPVGDQRRPLHGVRREQAGQPPGDGVAAVAPQRRLVAVEPVAEVGRRGSRTTARRGCRRSPRAAARPAGRGPTGRRARGRAASRPASAG